MLIIKNVSIFDGFSIIKNKTVLVSKSKILDVKSSSSGLTAYSNTRVIDGQENILIPGFIDLQINGGGGALFNRTPSPSTLRTIFQTHLKFGTTSYFPTLMSDSYEKMEQAVNAVKVEMKNPNSGVAGLHFEGPFLNPIKKGIHSEAYLIKSSEKILKLIKNSQISKKIVTVAPEVLDVKNLKYLNSKNIYLFAGHTNATSTQMKSYFLNGILGVTHLFNACSQMQARDSGVVGSSLLNTDAFNTIIADGVHVSDDSLNIAFKIKAVKKFALISDAMESVGSSKKSFQLYDKKIFLKRNKLVDASETLAGANLTILWAFQYLLRKKLVTLPEAIGMTSSNQAEFLGLKHKGAILPRFDANMLLINKKTFKLLNIIYMGKMIAP